MGIESFIDSNSNCEKVAKYKGLKYEGGDNMTGVLIEKERVEYLEGMESYIQDLKNKPKEEAKKIARESLIRSGILNKNGQINKHYRLDREN